MSFCVRMFVIVSNYLLTPLERDIVRVDIIFRILDPRAPITRHLLFRCCAIATPTSGFWPELDAVGNDLRAIFLFATCLIIPAARLQTPFHVGRTPLLEVLRHGVCLPTEDDDVVKVGLLLLLPLTVAVDAVGRDRKVAHIHAGGKRTKFGVTRKVAEQ